MSVNNKNCTLDRPFLDATHIRDYKHSGFMAQQLTIILGIGKDVPLLDNEAAGSALVREKLINFFSTIYKPKSTDPNLFLPVDFTPIGALQAAEKLSEGKEASLLIEKFIKSHTGVLVLDVSDIYFYRPESSWAVQCWILDTDHLDHINPDFYIRSGQTDVHDFDGFDYLNSAPLPDENEFYFSKENASDFITEPLCDPYAGIDELIKSRHEKQQ